MNITIPIGNADGLTVRWYMNGWHYFHFPNSYRIVERVVTVGTQVSERFSTISRVENPIRKRWDRFVVAGHDALTVSEYEGLKGLLHSEVGHILKWGKEWRVDVDRSTHTVTTKGGIYVVEVSMKLEEGWDFVGWSDEPPAVSPPTPSFGAWEYLFTESEEEPGYGLKPVGWTIDTLTGPYPDVQQLTGGLDVKFDGLEHETTFLIFRYNLPFGLYGDVKIIWNILPFQIYPSGVSLMISYHAGFEIVDFEGFKDYTILKDYPIISVAIVLNITEYFRIIFGRIRIEGTKI